MSCDDSIIYVVVHKYHLNCLVNTISASDMLVVVGDGCDEVLVDFPGKIIKFPFFEGLSIWRKIICRLHLYSCVKRTLLPSGKKIVVFGAQDFISWFIASRFNGSVELVVDNLEFILRPNFLPDEFKSTSLKGGSKAISYGIFRDYLFRNVVDFNGRFLYPVHEFKLRPDLAFYSRVKLRDSFGGGVCFISQPYYLDYCIDVSTWVEALDVSLLQKKCCYIKFHPRDSQEFIDMMLVKGYLSMDVPGGHVLGVFSTLLFEYALEGRKVFSIYDNFTDVLPEYYTKFVRIVADRLILDLGGQSEWDLDVSRLNDFFNGI